MRYRVLQPMQLHPGALLGLTAEQAAARSFGLAPQGALWLVVKPVGFKAGELIEHEGDLPKQLAQSAEALPVEPRHEKPAPAAAATPPKARKPARAAQEPVPSWPSPKI